MPFSQAYYTLWLQSNTLHKNVLVTVTENLHTSRSVTLSSVLKPLDLSAVFDTITRRSCLSSWALKLVVQHDGGLLPNKMDSHIRWLKWDSCLSSEVISSTDLSYHSYADGSQSLLFTFRHSNFSGLLDISLWMEAHHLKWHPRKSGIQYIPVDVLKHQDLFISLENSMITAQNCGVFLDNYLSFPANVSKVVLSCRLFLYSIKRIWSFISMEATQVLV